MADLDLTNFQGFLDYEGLDYFKEKNDDLTDEKIAVETNRAKSAESNLQDQINTKAPLASPALTGTPTAPTASSGTNTTQIATTAFVQTAVSNLINGAPETANTLKELSDLIEEHQDVTDALNAAIGKKADSEHTHNYAGSSSPGGDANNALKLSGYSVASSATSNTVALRNASGYLYATYFNQSSSAETATTSSYILFANSDGFFRKGTLASIKTALGLGSAAYTASTAYATASHTHNYAGSSSVGGIATNAARLSNTATIGSATQPVYFSANGVPVACTYTLAKSVPSSAVFTDDGVTITATTPSSSTAYYPTFYTATSGSSVSLFANRGVAYLVLNGTASASGYAMLRLGNGTSTGTAGNMMGYLDLYSSSTAYGRLYQAAVTSNVSHILPTTGGTILNTGTTSWTAGLTSGTTVGTLKINGTSYTLYAPTNTDTHYTTAIRAGASGTTTNAAVTSPYIKVLDNSTYRSQIRLIGGGATTVTSDASGNVTITSTNTTYSVATTSADGLMSTTDKTKLNYFGDIPISDTYSGLSTYSSVTAASQKALASVYSALNSAKAPTSHRSTATTYGVGNASYYGHVKVSDNYTSSAGAASASVAASSLAVYNAYNTLNTKLNGAIKVSAFAYTSSTGFSATTNYQIPITTPSGYTALWAWASSFGWVGSVYTSGIHSTYVDTWTGTDACTYSSQIRVDVLFVKTELIG